ncbi:MAG TPA: 50S ribosomal protein L25/general stress protein Ctc [Gammaproteobacteria bacterium]|nr:50S ribosomal protein L25/general stress protein Ctc [Gammaproteobacteria bacterium]
MSENFEINAELRSDSGKGASRRLRHEGRFPAIVYGGGGDPVSLTLDQNEMGLHLQHEAFYSHLLTLKIGSKKQKAIMRDIQRHPAKDQIMHIDFLRVSASETISMHIPLHFLNEDIAIGVKQQGGVVSHLMSDVEVSCKASNLPEYIEVDLTDLEAGSAIHMSEIKMPSGITLAGLAHGDQAVVNIHMPRGISEEAEDDAAPEEGGEEAASEGEGSES